MRHHPRFDGAVLLSNAAKRGTKLKFDSEYKSLEQDETGVTVTVYDHVAKSDFQIRAKYVIGADGGRSKVAEDMGLKYEGQMGVGGSMNIVFEADLSKYVAHRPSVLYWVLQPGADVGGIGMGLVRMVRPWDKWLIAWGYDISQGTPKVTDEMAISIVHSLVGDNTIDVKIDSTSVWTVNNMYAVDNTKGRVFCAGDAVHRHPPSNGLGSNTSIQDSYNLAWKLAHVLKGHADISLLETYEVERAPLPSKLSQEQINLLTSLVPSLNPSDSLTRKTCADESQYDQAQREHARSYRAARETSQGDSL